MQYLNLQLSCRNMIKFKMADMLDCWKPDYWPICLTFWCWFSISMVQKFDWRPNHGSNYGFLKIWFVTSLGCWFSIWIQNLVQKCWSTPKLWPKIEIKNGGIRHLGFFKIWLPKKRSPWAVFFTWVSNLVQKCWSMPKLWRKIGIQDGGHPPSWNSYITI